MSIGLPGPIRPSQLPGWPPLAGLRPAAWWLPVKLVAGLDLARRSDHSALVLLDGEPDRLTVAAALRLPQAPLRQQFALIAPHLAGLDLLVFDQSGLGDAAAELLPQHRRTLAFA